MIDNETISSHVARLLGEEIVDESVQSRDVDPRRDCRIQSVTGYEASRCK